MNDPVSKRNALESVLNAMGEVAVAVSGGVDSLTLGAFAHRKLGKRCTMFHAVSAAVPAEGTQRTRELAGREGWELHVIDAGEFDSGDYMRNPVNRCFYCKTSLYGSIRPHTSAQIVSGTNVDDLGEYRPGLIAAKEHDVRHPFVEAAMNKQQVRALARLLGLGEIAELPSSPCLSSRIETGIAIDPAMLACVHAAEKLVTERLAPETVRCRVRAKGVVIELDRTSLAGLQGTPGDVLTTEIKQLFREAGFDYAVGFEAYRIGSAFLHFKPLTSASPAAQGSPG